MTVFPGGFQDFRARLKRAEMAWTFDWGRSFGEDLEIESWRHNTLGRQS